MADGVDIRGLEGWLTKEKSEKGNKWIGDSNKRWFKVQAIQVCPAH